MLRIRAAAPTRQSWLVSKPCTSTVNLTYPAGDQWPLWDSFPWPASASTSPKRHVFTSSDSCFSGHSMFKYVQWFPPPQKETLISWSVNICEHLRGTYFMFGVDPNTAWDWNICRHINDIDSTPLAPPQFRQLWQSHGVFGVVFRCSIHWSDPFQRSHHVTFPAGSHLRERLYDSI